MNKYFVFTGIVVTVLAFANCNPSKRMAKKIPKTTYNTDLSVVIMNNCVPCHIPAKGGRKTPYDNYASVKKDIDEMIRRIELSPSVRGFMPFKGSQKLNDSTIAVFKKWRDDGFLEK